MVTILYASIHVLRFSVYQEGPEPVEEGVKLVVGHKFQLKTSTGTKHYCEKCNGVIWGLLHVWHRCAGTSRLTG